MTASVFLRLYLVALPVFLIIDLVWLGLIARSFYRSQIGHLMRAEVSWPAALAFYLIFVAGIVVFAVWPAIQGKGLGQAIVLGALLGLVTYAAFDLTSLAVLEGFPLTLVFVDLLWGVVLCSSVSAITYLIRAPAG
jgi:uncharacterized membrane protein